MEFHVFLSRFAPKKHVILILCTSVQDCYSFSGTHNRLGSRTQCLKAVKVPGLTAADVFQMDLCSNYASVNSTCAQAPPGLTPGN